MTDEVERHLLQSSANIYDVIEDMVEGGIVIDAAGKVRWISDDYMAFLGRTDRSDILGYDIEKLLPHSKMRQVVETGKAHPVDLMYYGERFLLVTRLPIRDRGGRVIGAFAFAFKDFMTHLEPLADRIRGLQDKLKQAEQSLASQRYAKFTFENIIGVSPGMVHVRKLARRAAQLNANILLLGETGTGKELVAHAIHSASDRFNKPFVSVNVAAIPDTLLEADFFGVAPGAYTGAGREARPGKFQIANKGTLFLDEIGDMPLPLQAKLLRVLQEREFEPLGSSKLIKVDVRIIAATSRNLAAMVQDGSFRPDLYYRLNVLPIAIPPLRERREDIELLARAHVERLAHTLDVETVRLGPTALEFLNSYDWPGNVRELGNVLEQACLRSDKEVLTAEDFAGILPGSTAMPPSRSDPDDDGLLADTVGRAEKSAVVAALKQTGGNKAAAAKLLGITRPSLYAKISKYGIASA